MSVSRGGANLGSIEGYHDIEVLNVFDVAKYNGSNGEDETGTVEIGSHDLDLARNEVAEVVAGRFKTWSATLSQNMPTDSGILHWIQQFGINEDHQVPNYSGSDSALDVDDDGNNEIGWNSNSADWAGRLYNTQGATYTGLRDSANGIAANPTVFDQTEQIDFREMFGTGPVLDRNDDLNTVVNLNAKSVNKLVEVGLQADVYYKVHEVESGFPF